MKNRLFLPPNLLRIKTAIIEQNRVYNEAAIRTFAANFICKLLPGGVN